MCIDLIFYILLYSLLCKWYSSSCGSFLDGALHTTVRLIHVKLALNADKIKLMLFSNARWKPVDIVTALEEDNNCYKYQRIWLLECLSFKQKKRVFPKMWNYSFKQHVYFRQKSFEGRGRLVAATVFFFFFLPVLDYGDLLYMNVYFNWGPPSVHMSSESWVFFYL